MRQRIPNSCEAHNCLAYPVPDELLSEEQYLRRHHFDLAAMDDTDLWREQQRVERGLSVESDPFRIEWLLERAFATEQVRAKAK
jgi:hypothetical protein